MSTRLGFSHLSLRFSEQVLFEDFSLDIPTGQVSCLSCPSGCGKTTLLRMLMGLQEPDLGRVHRILPLSAVFQEDRLLPFLSAPGNLRLVAGRGREMEIHHLLARLGLQEGDKPVRTFSGGMKRRVALARALIVPFELLILDEPFTGLDAAHKEQAAALILEMSKGRTILMASHAAEEARLLGAEMISL